MLGGDVIRIEDVAALERLAAAADAHRQAITNGLEHTNLLVEPRPPGLGEQLPLLLARRSICGQRLETVSYLAQREANLLGRSDEGDSSQDIAPVPSLPAQGAGRRDQPAILVEPQRRCGDAETL